MDPVVAPAPRSPTPMVDPTKQGWNVAALVVVLALVYAGTAFTIHKKTYRHPTDPSMHQVGSGQPSGH